MTWMNVVLWLGGGALIVAFMSLVPGLMRAQKELNCEHDFGDKPLKRFKRTTDQRTGEKTETTVGIAFVCRRCGFTKSFSVDGKGEES